MGQFDTLADAVDYIRALEQRVQDLSVAVAGLQRMTGGKATRSGSDTATWPGGGATSNTRTVAHGLGVIPTSAGAFSRDPLFEYSVVSRDATNIVVEGCITTNTVVGASSRTFDWKADG